jgi:uncharacterized protein
MTHPISTLIRGTLVVAALVFASSVAAKDKVVIQVSDADPLKWNLALGNARNMQTALGADQIDIEIVAYGPGVSLLKAADSPVATRITEAKNAGVRVLVCENTMAGMKLSHADMLGDVGYVPSGVVEILKKQQEGYAYLRP